MLIERKLITIKLRSIYAEKMDKLVEEGKFTSRADVVREALTRLFETLEEEKPKAKEAA